MIFIIGHSAKCGTYTIIEKTSKKIISLQLVQVTSCINYFVLVDCIIDDQQIEDI